MRQDKRKYPRFNYEKHIDFIIRIERKGSVEKISSNGTIKNMSKGGFIIATDNSLPDEIIGHKLSFTVKTENQRKRSFECKIVRIDKKGIGVKNI